MTAGTTARRDASVLMLGTFLSGVAAYGFLMLGTRALGATVFAPVSVLWSLWAVSSAAVTFPVQHWIIRTVEATDGDATIRAALPRVLLVVLGTGLVGFTVALAAGDALYPGPTTPFAVMTGLLPLGSALVGVSRGMLASRGHFGATATVILGENAIRVALVLALGGRFGAEGLGWAVLSGFLVTLAFPSALLPRYEDRGAPTTGILGLLGGLAGANVAAQAVLTSGPVLLSLLGGAPEQVTELFALLAVLRAPYMVSLGVTARVTGPLTRALEGSAANVSRSMRRLAGTAVVTATGAAGLAPLVLPPVTRLAFGFTPAFSGVVASVLAAGSVLALANLGFMLVLVAGGGTSRLWRSWTLGLLVGLVVLGVPLTPVLRVSLAFLAAEIAAFLAMGSALLSRRPVEDTANTPAGH